MPGADGPSTAELLRGESALSTDNAVGYLRARGVLADRVPARATALSGGISNMVVRVDWPGRSVVVKQSLPMLRVAEPWPFDRRRILGECACMNALGEILPEGSVPEVIDVDRDRLTFTMTCAPDGGEVWKDGLLRGEVDPVVARRAAALLGAVHRASAASLELADQFDDLMPLIEGRVDPYHRTTASVHPDLAASIEADIARLTTRRRALVLGDYSPKNLIVYPDRVLALDFEVAHWGDPAFDTAFMLTHLVAKAVALVDRRDALLSAAREFWEEYRRLAGDGGAREDDTATELAVLLLCRVDGKSQLEYLSPASRTLLRGLARGLALRREPTVEAVLETVAALPEVGATG